MKEVGADIDRREQGFQDAVQESSKKSVQEALKETPEGQQFLRQRATRRAASALYLLTGLLVFLLWLPYPYRRVLLRGFINHQALVVLVLLFGLVAVSLLWSAGQRLDVRLFKFFNLGGYRAAWMNAAMWIATQIGNFGFALLVVILTYAAGARRYAILLTLGSLTLLLLVTVLKAITDRARPFRLMPDVQVVGIREPGLSFPSGHTAQTFFMMTVTIRHFQLPLTAALVLYAVAALVGFSRVYLGVHYPRDVIAGGLVGLLWGTMAVLIAPYF